MVGVDEQGPFRNKNGFLSQNVLAACSFDLKFHYVLAGWEGSATDSRVLNSALTRRNNLKVPEGFIAPYNGVRYPTNEIPGIYAQDARELFNQRHSILRNVTDRIFAVLKERFPILMSVPPYPLQTQVKLVVAACAIHNFIRNEKRDDWLFKMYEQDIEPPVEESMPQVEVEPVAMIPFETQSSEFVFAEGQLEAASQLRDAIATEMWSDHVRSLSIM
uniref:DDE Tnp4 domain-containing protein n=1 Tax=Nelumbo nucifera TaxID=4432 RepID=A0A822YWJ8_NELNU|nr:TPA_asm: hypothetical protein HUJ06_006531 [Nelumbo nucifera]